MKGNDESGTERKRCRESGTERKRCRESGGRGREREMLNGFAVLNLKFNTIHYHSSQPCVDPFQK